MNLQTPVRVETLADQEQWWALEVRRRRERNKILARAFASKRPDDVAAIAIERERCRQSIEYWIDNYGWTAAPQELDTENPYRTTVPLVLWPRQRLFLRWLMERYRLGRVGIAPKSRSVGGSYILMHFVFHGASYLRGFGALLLSRKEDLVDDTTESDRQRAAGKRGLGSGDKPRSLLGKLDYIYSKQPPWIAPNIELPRHPMEMRFLDTGALLQGESTNTGAGKGDRQSIVVIDEMAAMKPEIQTQIWEGLASVANCRIAVSAAGSPWHKFEALRGTLPEDAVFEMDYDADPRRNAAWREQQIAELGLDGFLTQFGMRPIRPSAGRIWQRVDSTTKGLVYTDADLTEIEPDARGRWQVFGAWDFGSGPSLLVCFLFLVEFRDGSYRLWLDQEMTWDQEAWRTVASDILDGRQGEDGYIEGGMRRTYKRFGVHFGDPSGVNRESDQNSWVTNLQAGGVPLVALSGECNTKEQREWQVRKVGAMLQDGTLRVHERCQYALNCIDNWTRHLRAGTTVESSSTMYIPPKHDKWSHGGTALCFGIAGILPAAAAVLAGAEGVGEDAGGGHGWHPAAPSYLEDAGSLDSILAAI